MKLTIHNTVYNLGDTLYRARFKFKTIDSPTFVYLHVPKTAGISMRRWLEMAHSRRRVFWQSKAQNRVLDNVMGENGVEYFNQYEAIGGHIEFTNPSVQSLLDPKIFSAVIRKPIEQVISHFEYASMRPDHVLHTGGTLEDALIRDTAFRRVSKNIQCRFAAGSTNALDALSIIQENNYILGCFDYLQEYVNCVASTLAVPNRRLPEKNSQDIVFEKHYTQKAAEIIEEITGEDEILYQYARKNVVYSNLAANTKILSKDSI